MRPAAALSFAAAAAAALLFRFFGKDVYLTLAITFGTIFYHLGVRLLVGALYNAGMNNRADHTKRWYQLRPWENRLYRALNVKAWKAKMPTYRPELFSPQNHSWDEIAQAMCQAELVHETNALLSFPPILASRWFGSFSVFLITSVCGAAFDLSFAVVQRYNRARVVKIASRKAGTDKPSCP